MHHQISGSQLKGYLFQGVCSPRVKERQVRRSQLETDDHHAAEGRPDESVRHEEDECREASKIGEPIFCEVVSIRQEKTN